MLMILSLFLRLLVSEDTLLAFSALERVSGCSMVLRSEKSPTAACGKDLKTLFIPTGEFLRVCCVKVILKKQFFVFEVS